MSFFFSCNKNYPIPDDIIKAQALMLERPDSALLILEGMKGVEHLPAKLKATYNLCLIEARDKNYIVHFLPNIGQTDSTGIKDIIIAPVVGAIRLTHVQCGIYHWPWGPLPTLGIASLMLLRSLSHVICTLNRQASSCSFCQSIAL